MINLDKNNFKQIFPDTHNIVFLHAHCDDESFLSAGILSELSKIGEKCTVIYGAAATVEGQEKTYIRQKQTRKALSILGVDSVFFLKYCEPKFTATGNFPLASQNIEDVSSDFWNCLLDNGIKLPISLVSYDKNGGYGNNDHKIIHLIGKKIKANHTASVSLSEITMNRDKINKWLEDAKNRLDPKSLPLLSYWSKKFGLPENGIEYCYELTDKQMDLKRKSLACHTFFNTPELFPLALKKTDFKRVLGFEFLHILKSELS